MRDFLALFGLVLLAVGVVMVIASSFVVIWTVPEVPTDAGRLLASGALSSVISFFLLAMAAE